MSYLDWLLGQQNTMELNLCILYCLNLSCFLIFLYVFYAHHIIVFCFLIHSNSCHGHKPQKPQVAAANGLGGAFPGNNYPQRAIVCLLIDVIGKAVVEHIYIYI